MTPALEHAALWVLSTHDVPYVWGTADGNVWLPKDEASARNYASKTGLKLEKILPVLATDETPPTTTSKPSKRRKK